MAKTNKVSKPEFSAVVKQFVQKHRFEIIVLAFSFALYSNTLFNNYNLDDELVTRNHKLTSQGIAALPQIFTSPYYSDDMGYSYDYRPITLVSFAFEHQFFGDNVFVGHLINVLLYAFVCLLIFTILKELLPDQRTLAFFVALLFAAHPIHTEVVCSLKNRDELLSFLFSALSMLVVLRTSQRQWLLRFVAAGLLMIIALLSKTTIVAMVIIIPVTIIVFRDCNLKKIVTLSLLLLVPALLLVDISLLIYKLLLLIGAEIILVAIYFIKNVQGYQIKASLHARLNRIRQLSKRSANVPVSKNTNKKPIHKESEIAQSVSRNTGSKGWLNSEITRQGGLIVVSFLAAVISAYALYFDDFKWLYPGAALLICGLFFYRKVTWNVNAIMALVIGLLIMEKYDSPVNVISNAINILFLCAVFFHKSKNKVFVVGLYIAFILHFHFINLVDWTSIIFPIAFFYLVAKYKDRFRSFVIGFSGAAILNLAYSALLSLINPSISNVADVPNLFVIIALLVYITGKGIRPVVGFILLFVIFAFMMESNLPAYAPYKNISFTKNIEYFKIYNVVTKYEIASVADAGRKIVNEVTSRTVYKVKEAENSLVLKKTTVVKKIDNAKHDFSKQIEKANEKIKTAQNTVVTYQVKKITPVEEDRPLSYVENPVNIKDPLEIKIASSFDALLRYIKLVVLPYPLSFYYGYKVFSPASFSQPQVIISVALHLFVLLLAVIFLIKRKYTLFYSIAFYLLMIVPFANVWSIPGIIGERYLFGASLGFCLLLGYGLFYFLKVDLKTALISVPNKGRYAAAVILLFYTSLTISRNFFWKDDLTLMRHDIKNVDQSAQGHNILALTLMAHSTDEQNAVKQSEMRSEAVFHFKRALEIYPGFFNAAYDMARAYAELNMSDSAIATYKFALTLNAKFTNVQLNLADLLEQKGMYADALTYYNAALKDHLHEYSVYGKISFTYFLMKDFDGSIKANRLALQNVPGTPEPLINIGRALYAKGEQDSAVYYYDLATRLYPNHKLVKELMQPNAH